MANTFNKNQYGDIMLEYRLSHTQSDNLMLSLCNKTGYHVHSVTNQHYKCFNTVDVGYSKSLQFKDLTKSKQDVKGVYLWCIQKVSGYCAKCISSQQQFKHIDIWQK